MDKKAAKALERAAQRVKDGNSHAAEAAYDQAFRILQAAGDRRGLGDALVMRAETARAYRRHLEALQHLNAAVPYFQQVGDRGGLARVRLTQALVLHDQGDVVGATGRAHECIAAAEGVDPLRAGLALVLLARMTGDAGEAEHLRYAALRYVEQAPGAQAQAAALRGLLADAAENRGDLTAALAWLELALPSVPVGPEAFRVRLTHNRARLLHQLGRPQEALRLLMDATPEGGAPLELLDQLAELAFVVGDGATVAQASARAAAVARRSQRLDDERTVLLRGMDLSLDEGDVATATTLFEGWVPGGPAAQQARLVALDARLRAARGGTDSALALLADADQQDVQVPLARVTVLVRTGAFTTALELLDDLRERLATSAPALPAVDLERARVLRLVGDAAGSAMLLATVGPAALAFGLRPLHAFVLVERAALTADRAEAERLLAHAVGELEGCRRPLSVARTQVALGGVRPGTTALDLEPQIALLRRAEDLVGVADARLVQSTLLAAAGDRIGADDCWRQAGSLFLQAGDVPGQARAAAHPGGWAAAAPGLSGPTGPN